MAAGTNIKGAIAAYSTATRTTMRICGTAWPSFSSSEGGARRSMRRRRLSSRANGIGRAASTAIETVAFTVNNCKLKLKPP